MRAKEFITERKKRKRRSKSKRTYGAVWGPGPYGLYGWDAGYSGSGGISSGDGGGGVGEASYPGNIGAMEVIKFMQQAGPEEKAILKQLLDKKDYRRAWALIQGLTGVKLQGKEFAAEGWKDTLAGLALGAGIAMGGSADAKVNTEKVVVSPGQTVYSIARAFDTTPQTIQKLNKLDKNFTIKPGQELKVPSGEEVKKPEANKKTIDKEIKISKADLEDSVTGRPLEVYFRKFLESQGIKDQELAAIMAQSDVETDHFKTLKEYGSKNYFKMYEPVFRKDKKTGKLIMDPETKKPKHFNDLADRLGNDYRGDGARYKGRGFLQVTGRYNYRIIGQDIGVDLEKNPEILETNKEIAAKASLAYWKRFSKPKIKNFKDVKGVTSTINPGLKHLEKRKERHKEYKVAMQ